MPDLRPFRAVVYDEERAGPYVRNVSEPYDKVTQAMREAYLAASPYNVVRLTLPRAEKDGEDPYQHAKRLFRSWLEEGILRRNEAPGFYLYDQTAEVDGVRRTRRSFLALTEAREYGEGHVLPHERTFPEPKADRMALLRACRANFGVVFLLYEQPGREAISALERAPGGSQPVASVELPDGASHRVSAVTDPEAVHACREAMRDVTCVIADGHHRFETSVAFRREREEHSDLLPGMRYRLTALVEASDPGLIVLPAHRLLPPGLPAAQVATRAAALFDVEALGDGSEALPARIRAALAGAGERATFVVADPDGAHRLTLKAGVDLTAELSHLHPEVRTLDVAVLHGLLLERALGLPPAEKEHTLGYARHLDDALERTREGRYGSVCALRPATPQDVIRVARARTTMPQKSTDFFPKMLSGMVIADLEDRVHAS